MLVVDPSIAFAEDAGVGEIARGWPGRVTVLRPALEPGGGPHPGDRFPAAAAIVIMGSRASVNDSQPWLDGLRGWLLEELAAATPRPLLGICFGHQLLASACGGRVGFVHADRSAVRGVVPTAFRGGRLVPGDRTLVVVASHAEHVVDPPRGFDVTATRPESPCDALEHPERPLFAVQFHPEAREGFLERRGIDPRTVDPRVFEDGRAVLDAFRRYVLSRVAFG